MGNFENQTGKEYRKLNNITLSYSDHADIQISLLVHNGIHLGRPKLFSYKKLHKFIIGNFKNYEIMNLIWSRRILVYQVSYIIKYAVRIQSWKTTTFAIASVNNQFKECFQSWSYMHNIDCFGGDWIPGTFSAKLAITKPSYFAIIPDCTRSARIVIEANISAIPIIGLVSSNNTKVDHITYPVFGNEYNYATSLFFCRLCAALILKEQQKTAFKSLSFKKSFFRFHNFILRIKRLQLKYRHRKKRRNWNKKNNIKEIPCPTFWKRIRWQEELKKIAPNFPIFLNTFYFQHSLLRLNKYKQLWEPKYLRNLRYFRKKLKFRSFGANQAITHKYKTRTTFYWRKYFIRNKYNKFWKFSKNIKILRWKNILKILSLTIVRLYWTESYLSAKWQKTSSHVYLKLFGSKLFYITKNFLRKKRYKLIRKFYKQYFRIKNIKIRYFLWKKYWKKQGEPFKKKWTHKKCKN